MGDRRHRVWILSAALLMLAALVSVACAQYAPSATAAAPADQAAVAPSPDPLRVVFFFRPGCEHCAEAEEGLAAAEARWGERIRVERMNVKDSAVAQLAWRQYLEHYGVFVTEPPAVFVGRQMMTNSRQIKARLAKVVGDELNAGNRTYDPSPPKPPAASTEAQSPVNSAAAPADDQQQEVAAEQTLVAELQEKGIWVILGAGLVDGINPCAFTTIVFLMSAMAYLRQSRKRMVVAGLSFAAGVFVMYTLLGVGLVLLWEIKDFAVHGGVTWWVSVAIAAMAFGLAAWSLRDFVVMASTGHKAGSTLGLPKPVRAMINRVIRSGLGARSVVLGAAATGLLVALLESVCTGQVYIPAITIMVRTPGLRDEAMMYLLIYNVMFILPLLAVLAAAWFGLSSQRLGQFAARHVGVSKLALALLFAALGTLIVVTL